MGKLLFGREKEMQSIPRRVLIAGKLSVSSNVKETASRVVRSGSKGVAIREEGHSVDVALVSVERLRALARADVPELGNLVAGAAHERVLVRVDRETHYVVNVIIKLCNLGGRVDVPEDARRVA